MEYECKKCFGWGQNTGQPVGSMGGFEGGNELLTVLGLGQWTRHVGVAEGRVEKLKEKFCGDGSSVMGLRAAERSPVSAPIQVLQQNVQGEGNSGTRSPPMGLLHHPKQYRMHYIAS